MGGSARTYTVDPQPAVISTCEQQEVTTFSDERLKGYIT
jgi:hypothetical protein